jgi:hypothetical protein
VRQQQREHDRELSRLLLAAKHVTGIIAGETWVRIKGYPNYAVSSHGRVMNARTGKVLKQFLDGQDYPKVKVSRGNGYQRSRSVARLTALHHVPNPDAKPEVNHKSGVKIDNQTTNLEWVTHPENMKHRWAMVRAEAATQTHLAKAA